MPSVHEIGPRRRRGVHLFGAATPGHPVALTRQLLLEATEESYDSVIALNKAASSWTSGGASPVQGGQGGKQGHCSGAR